MFGKDNLDPGMEILRMHHSRYSLKFQSQGMERANFLGSRHPLAGMKWSGEEGWWTMGHEAKLGEPEVLRPKANAPSTGG